VYLERPYYCTSPHDFIMAAVIFFID